jgi:hypothetical protein
LEGQLRQFEVIRQFAQHPPAIVAGVHEAASGIWSNGHWCVSNCTRKAITFEVVNLFRRGMSLYHSHWRFLTDERNCEYQNELQFGHLFL